MPAASPLRPDPPGDGREAKHSSDGARPGSAGFDAAVEASWTRFRSELGDVIAELGPDDVFTVEPLTVASSTDRVVQCFGLTGGGVRVELPSNHYLSGTERLTEPQEAFLVELGLHRPRDRFPADRDLVDAGFADAASPVFWREEAAAYADRLAVIITRVLRELWDIPDPAFAAVCSPSAERVGRLAPTAPGEASAFSMTMTVAVTHSDQLRELIIRTLEEGLGFTVEYDRDGDPVVRLQGIVVHIWPAPGSPAISLAAAVLREAIALGPLVDQVRTHIEAHTPFTVELMGRHLVVQHSFDAQRFRPRQLAWALTQLSHLLVEIKSMREAAQAEQTDRLPLELSEPDQQTAESVPAGLPPAPAPLLELMLIVGNSFEEVTAGQVFRLCGTDAHRLQEFVDFCGGRERAWRAQELELILRNPEDAGAADDARTEADLWHAVGAHIARALALITAHPSADRRHPHKPWKLCDRSFDEPETGAGEETPE